jgi:glycerol-3-phosphate O-acyltransferase / dihydroxyacetone phosphate acyltransferase
VSIYSFVRPFAKLGAQIFFRKIYCSNAERIPWGKPLILAVNHPTGFMEPMLLAVLLPKPLYILVRGDIFAKPFYARLLRGLNLIPIFRQRDKGLGAVKNNLATFEACYEDIKAGKTIVIFPEGRTIFEKRLRPLQKGICRLAFGALERHSEMKELYIVPICANFWDAENPRSQVMIDVGEPIPAHAYFRGKGQSDGQDLLDALAAAMSKHLVIVENPEDDELAEHLLTLQRSEHPSPRFPAIAPDRLPLQREQELTAKLNAMTAPAKSDLLQNTRAYFSALQDEGLRDRSVVLAAQSSPFTLIWFALLAIPAWAGRIFAWLPAFLARSIKEKRVKKMEYFLPVWAGLSWLLFLFYYILWLIIAAISGQWWIFGMALALGALAYGGLLYQEEWHNWIMGRRYAKLSDESKSKFEGLRARCKIF